MAEDNKQTPRTLYEQCLFALVDHKTKSGERQITIEEINDFVIEVSRKIVSDHSVVIKYALSNYETFKKNIPF